MMRLPSLSVPYCWAAIAVPAQRSFCLSAGQSFRLKPAGTSVAGQQGTQEHSAPCAAHSSGELWGIKLMLDAVILLPGSLVQQGAA